MVGLPASRFGEDACLTPLMKSNRTASLLRHTVCYPRGKRGALHGRNKVKHAMLVKMPMLAPKCLPMSLRC